MHYLVAIVCASLLAACPASSQPRGEEEEPTPAPTGHSGFENTFWGMTAAKLQEQYPAATLAGQGVLLVGDYRGRRASLLFKLENDALVGIDLALQQDYETMAACGVDWEKLRTELLETLGKSQTDNLAAYWENNTRDVTLSCEPDPSGRASLKAHFVPHREDD